MSYNNLSPVATIEVLKFAISLFPGAGEDPLKLAVALTPWDADEFVREERKVNTDVLFVVRDSDNLQVYSWNLIDAAQYAAVKAREGKKVAILALQEVTNSMRVYDDLQQELQLHELFGMPDWVWRDLTWGRSDDWSGFGDEDLAWQITQEVAHLRDTSWWMAYRDNLEAFAVEGLPWGACNNLE
jgi:hypothetical protein